MREILYQVLVIPTKPVLDLIGEWESSISGYFGDSGFPLEFIPWIPAFAGMTYGAGMTVIFATLHR